MVASCDVAIESDPRASPAVVFICTSRAFLHPHSPGGASTKKTQHRWTGAVVADNSKTAVALY